VSVNNNLHVCVHVLQSEREFSVDESKNNVTNVSYSTVLHITSLLQTRSITSSSFCKPNAQLAAEFYKTSYKSVKLLERY